MNCICRAHNYADYAGDLPGNYTLKDILEFTKLIQILETLS
jgi:hypothetical protein